MSHEVITIETPEYECWLYSKNGEGKLVKGTDERDAMLSTGQWFDSPDVAKTEIKKELELAKDKLVMSDAEIEKQLTDRPSDIKPDDKNVNALKQAANNPAVRAHVETVKDEDDKKGHKGK